MKFELDDPKLTAYALGELNDTEKAEVEAFLNENEAARNEVAHIREAAQWLSAELAADKPEGLSELEQARIMDQAKKPKPARRVPRTVWVLAASALIMVWLGSTMTLGPSMMSYRQKSAMANRDFMAVSKAKPVQLAQEQLASKPELSVSASAPAPAEAPATASDGYHPAWDSVGTKSMSQQAVTGMPEKPKEVSASAPAAPASAGASPQLWDNVAANNLKIETADSYGYGLIRKSARSMEELKALGYAGANAPGVAEKKKDAQPLQAYIQPTPPPPPTPVPGSESYPVLPENTFQRVVDAPLSTFGLDVDTASYANVRRFLSQGTLPPGEAVRIEELVNYFKYDYPKPEGDAPFSVTVDAHPCPWAPTHTLARIGVRGKELNTETRPPANLVFLIDVSGSMQDADKLPLLKKGMKLLAQTVTANDRVSIVTYASGTGVALYPTPGDNKTAIESIIDSLQAGGSTNGEGGIQLAYDLARRAFIQGGVNRVILATDGDFNVGVSDTNTLVGMIEQQAKTGVALSVLGFGQGNLKDERLMKLADKGNGNYNYIDSFQEARKALLEQATGTLFTIAKDVKIQIEFNPGRVGAYRLIGYEKRMLAAQDFNDDRKDAGEIGAGHTVTALYELVPPGEPINPPQTDPLKYQTNAAPAPTAPESPEMMTVKLRFKPPTGDVSTRFDVPVPATVVTAETRPDFQFASAVAAFGILLRHSSYAGAANMDMVINLAQQGKGGDPDGLRAEFINLAKTAAALMGTPKPGPGQE